MKRTFLILVLLVAFNFANPTGQVYSQNVRHNIEFVKVDKSRSRTNDELIRNKVIMYLRYQVLLMRVNSVNARLEYNTS